MQEGYDLIIIGAGPMGLACAIEAKKANLKYVILEKGVLVNSLFHFPTNMTFFSTSNLLEIGEVPFISHTEKPTRREALEYYRRVWQSWDLDVHLYEPVTEVEKNARGFRVVSDKDVYQTKSIVVATGFYDLEVKLNVPGEDLPKVSHYYEEAHPYVGQELIVVGAANSACQVALETYLRGANVTMVIRSAKIYDRVKYWIKPNIENRIKEGSIKAYFESEIIQIEPKQVLLKTPKGEVAIANDFVLAMTGYKPDYSLLHKLGIEIRADQYQSPVYKEDTFETNVPGIYIAGVICGGMKTNKFFIENSRSHAEAIIHDLRRKVEVDSV